MKLSTLIVPSLIFILVSCQKTSNQSEKSSTSQQSPIKAGTQAPGGGTTPSSGGQVSGVDLTTGYEPLIKHYQKNADGSPYLDPNGNLVYDGTYDAIWYNNQMNITIVTYKTYSGLGDPVSAYIHPSSGSDFNITTLTGFGDGASSFTLVYQVCNFSNWSTYSADDIGSFNTSFNQFIASNGSSAYPASGMDSTMLAWSGCKLITVYGKLIKIPTGTGFALAELAWKPPTPVCNAQCQYCIAHPNDPSCP